MAVTHAPLTPGTRALLERHRAGALSAPVALMELLLALADVELVRAAVAEDPALVRLLEANAAGVVRICAMVQSGKDSGAPVTTSAEVIASARELFDWSVQQSEEASVALYSLGNPVLLDEATREIVALLRARALVSSSMRILQIGCGIGRLEHALAPHVESAHGIDVSPKMIEVARRRCAGIANVHVALCSGLDLSDHATARFELVYAVDSFPYLVNPGLALARTHFLEAARVLVPGGSLVIMGFSYRNDLALDSRDVRALALEAGFDVVTLGEKPFALWDGALFHVRKPARET